MYTFAVFLIFSNIFGIWADIGRDDRYFHHPTEEPHNPKPTVVNSVELDKAFNNAKPGDVITLNPGIYDGSFIIRSRKGTSKSRITVKGSDSNTILSNINGTFGFNIYLYNCEYWDFSNFVIKASVMGVVSDMSMNNTFSNLQFEGGSANTQFGMMFRFESSGNKVDSCKFSQIGSPKVNVYLNYRAGLQQPIIPATAISIGTEITEPDIKLLDKSNDNIISNNEFGPNIYGLFIDIKEGSYRNKILHNHFQGPNLPQFEEVNIRPATRIQSRDQQQNGSYLGIDTNPDIYVEISKSICDDENGCWVQIKGDYTEVRDNWGEGSLSGSGFLVNSPTITFLVKNKTVDYFDYLDQKWGCFNYFKNNSCQFQPDEFSEEGQCVNIMNMNEENCSNFVHNSSYPGSKLFN